MRKARPAVIVFGCLATARVRDRERDEFGSRRLVTGEADGEPPAERLQVFQEELRISTAAAEAHSIQGFIEEVSYLLQIAGRRDQLKAAEIFSFGHAVDHVCVINLPVFPR